MPVLLSRRERSPLAAGEGDPGVGVVLEALGGRRGMAKPTPLTAAVPNEHQPAARSPSPAGLRPSHGRDGSHGRSKAMAHGNTGRRRGQGDGAAAQLHNSADKTQAFMKDLPFRALSKKCDALFGLKSA